MRALRNVFNFRTLLVVAIPFLVHCASAPSNQPGGLTSRELWAQYQQDPDHHPNLPNNSYAGYHQGEVLSGDPSTFRLFDIKKFGAQGDGVADDTAALQEALAEARKEKAGGVVFLPQGKYRLSDRLVLGGSRVVLAGEGPEKTILIFEKSLSEIERKDAAQEPSPFAWTGGLIHLGPAEDLDREGWGADDSGVGVVKAAGRGDRILILKEKLSLKPGDWVFLLWGRSFDPVVLNEIAGFDPGTVYPWEEKGKRWLRRRLPWPVQVKSVRGNELTLAQPLRLSLRPDQGVLVQKMSRFIEESGVEDLAIEMKSKEADEHLKEKGFNGIFVHRAVHSWVRNVRIKGADSGVLLGAAKNITVSRVILAGERRMHHGFYAKDAHDCLFTDFNFETPTIHGINADVFGSGNVWRRGVLSRGTFDTHHGLQFDLIRTDLDVHNDGKSGGREEDGPQQGQHVVHWNIRLQGKVDNVNQPELMPKGALVGIQGAPAAKSLPGGAIVADPNLAPVPSDLYEAELDFRLDQAGGRH